MEKLETAKRYEIGSAAEAALTAPKFEKRPGWCQRWVKQVLYSAGVPVRLVNEGAESARDAFEKYKDAGLVMPSGTVANIGDLLYKVRARDGRFGHVGIYVGNGNVAENSSAHFNGTRPDARGTRDISNFPGYRVVRLWR